MHNKVHVVAVHKLPFDPAGLEADLAAVADEEPEVLSELRAQFRENWSNAWLIVVELDGPVEELDFDEFGQGEGDNAQVPWEEAILESGKNKSRAAFYLHYLDPTRPMYYGDVALELPPVTVFPKELKAKAPYCSPD
jgi:hypothetical protein